MDELVAARTRLRTKATRLCNDLRTYRQEDRNSLDQDQLALKIHHVKKLLDELQDTQTQLDKLGQTDETSHIQTMEDELFLSSRVLARLERADEAKGMPDPKISAGNVDFKSSLAVKIPVFSGDVLKWSEFWELFLISVHQNPGFEDVQKFVVLKSHLAGVALRAIQGIPVSGPGYTEAVEALKERFDRSDFCRETLMKELLNMNAVRSNDLKALRSLIDHIAAHTRALNSLGVTAESFSSLLLPIIKEKLPESWRVEWARQEKSEFAEFLRFLQQEIRVQESARSATAPDAPSKSPNPSASVVASLNAQRMPRPSIRPSSTHHLCPACNRGAHRLSQCESFLEMDPEARWTVASAAMACYRCLLVGHRARNCQVGPCRECGQNHHVLLHRPSSSNLPQSSAVGAPPLTAAYRPSPAPLRLRDAEAGSRDDRCDLVYRSTSSGPSQPAVAALVPPTEPFRLETVSAGSAEPKTESRDVLSGRHRYQAGGGSDGSCFFQTALVKVGDPQNSRMVRILLDGGSDSSYIRSSLAEELGLPVVGTGTFSCIGFQERLEEPRQYDRVRADLSSRFGDGHVTVDLWSTERVCSPLPVPSLSGIAPQMPERMADDFKGGDIDILIGIDNIYGIVLWEQFDVGEGLRAVDTVFGYVMHGRHTHSDECIYPPCRRTNLRCMIDRMWDLDTVGITEKEATDRDPAEESLPVWNPIEERYEMGLIWRSKDRPVTNRIATEVRTQKMTERLSEEKLNLYHSQMSDMLASSIIEPGEGGTEADCGLQSETGGGQAATDCRLQSELKTVQSSESRASSAFFLPHRGVFGKEKLRIVFDGSAKDGVGKSLNEYLEPGDNLLRKLPGVLLNFRNGEIGCQSDIKSAFHQVSVKAVDRKYLQFFWSDFRLRFARVPFGLSCSPSMLLRTVETHLDGYEATDSELCAKIRASLYMDDICAAFSTQEEAGRAMSRMTDIFSKANMPLHKSRVTGQPAPDGKVLGVLWSTVSDRLAVTVPELQTPTTKRELLSTISKTFDPLGVLSPWMIKGKVLFQRMWKETAGGAWDDPLPKTLQKEVESWWNKSEKFTIWFPRSLANGDDMGQATYHVFCDASQHAYCCVIYLVSEGGSRLVMAKSRLAPLNPSLTIPRMELLAALIGARLMSFISDVLQLREPKVVFWTDSTDVLHWIRNRRTRKVFVENRVTAILELTDSKQWHHVRGVENPADLGTRGITLSALSESSMWWNGPSFILTWRDEGQDEDAGVQLSPEAQAENKAEGRPQVITTAVAFSTESDRLFDITECSSLKKVIERTAWVMRFLFNVRHQKEDRITGSLTPEERRHALQFWIKEAQEKEFYSDIRCVRRGALLPKGSSLMKLRPRLDEDDVLCAVPRTMEPPLPILPEFAHITALIIDDAHRRCFHQNARVTLALLSGEYLVRRRSVNRVVNTCTRCRRYRGLSYQPREGGLPSFRTQPCRPFSRVGLDFFGPLFVDEGKKVWVLLFTCATSRAIHLELVRSQSTDDVKRALRRFFALRSVPELILSDNAKTFHALIGHLPRSVTWRFIPEAAPWWGGFWERMVGVTKKCLKITLHQCHLSFDELAVVLYELAFHINLRPLTLSDEEPLTPAHLLFGVTSIHGVMGAGGVSESRVNRAWRHRRRVSDHLTRRWNQEYVSALRAWTVSPRGRPTRLPAVGDVVLVHGDGPRSRWPLARVESLISGPDGHCRAAVILMRGRRTRRPLNKLYQLEAATV